MFTRKQILFTVFANVRFLHIPLWYYKDLGVLSSMKLSFHHHTGYIFCQSVNMLGLIRTINFTFSTVDFILILHLTAGHNFMELHNIYRRQKALLFSGRSCFPWRWKVRFVYTPWRQTRDWRYISTYSQPRQTYDTHWGECWLLSRAKKYLVLWEVELRLLCFPTRSPGQGVKIPGAWSPGRLNFVQWRLIFTA
jgi:hypothetical protein